MLKKRFTSNFKSKILSEMYEVLAENLKKRNAQCFLRNYIMEHYHHIKQHTEFRNIWQISLHPMSS